MNVQEIMNNFIALTKQKEWIIKRDWPIFSGLVTATSTSKLSLASSSSIYNKQVTQSTSLQQTLFKFQHLAGLLGGYYVGTMKACKQFIISEFPGSCGLYLLQGGRLHGCRALREGGGRTRARGGAELLPSSAGGLVCAQLCMSLWGKKILLINESVSQRITHRTFVFKNATPDSSRTVHWCFTFYIMKQGILD